VSKELLMDIVDSGPGVTERAGTRVQQVKAAGCPALVNADLKPSCGVARRERKEVEAHAWHGHWTPYQ